MQSHILFSFTTKGKIVTFLALLAFAVMCTGCGRKKKEAFTQTIYAQDSGNQGSPAGSSHEAQGGSDPGSQANSGGTGESKSGADPAKRQICVFVCGAVAKEGVYYLDEGSRVIDAVNAAGGYREDADRVYVNQAEYVYDAERVNIPTVDETQALRPETGMAHDDTGAVQNGAGAGAGHSGNGRININTASKTELMQIPGIGESKAERIISYRENHGRFGSIEEIQNVRGIGSGIYEGMKDYITAE